MSAGAQPTRLAGLNLWSTYPADLAELLGDALGITLTSRSALGGQHFSGRAGQLLISVHPSDEAGVEPTRISFVTVLHFIIDEFRWLTFTKPGAIPSRLADLRRRLRTMILPPRRTDRSYPRAVKVKMSNYPRKRRPGATVGGGAK